MELPSIRIPESTQKKKKKKLYSADARRQSVNTVSSVRTLSLTLLLYRGSQIWIKKGRKDVKHTVKDIAYNSQWKLS